MSGAALFDESALPEWLRSAAADQSAGGAPPYAPTPQQPGISGGFPRPQQPQSVFMPSGWSGQAPGMPPAQGGGFGGAANMPDSFAPGGTMPGSSLMDASALPTWLGGSGAAAAPAGPALALGGDGLSAQSLVDERSLPIWLRQEPATPAVEPPPAGSISQWLAAPVTDEPLPTWLNQVYSSAQVPRIPGEPPLNEPWTASHAAVSNSPPAWYRPAVAPGAMPLGPLADDRAVPTWQAGPAGGSAGSFGYFGGGFGASNQGTQEPPAGQGFGGWNGNLNAAPMSPPMSPAGAGQPGPLSPAVPVDGAADAPVAAFSASDLIDPDALPPWVQQQAAHEEPTFSSAAGWTSKSRSLEAAGRAPVAAPMAQMSASLQAPGAMMSPGRDFGEANLPPWLQQGAPPSALPAGGQSGGVRNAARGAIPEAELPPWLRGAGGGPAAGRGGQPMAAPPSQAWGGGYAPQQPGYDDVFDDNWGEPMAGPPPNDGPVQHYADLFADERPGANRRFSYDVDHSSEPLYPNGAGEEVAEDWDEPRRGKGRKRWFGRR